MFQTVITVLFTTTIVYITYRIFRFYERRKRYPKGPIPLPLIGNILLFRGHKTHPLESLLSVRAQYGPVYTFYMGNDPFVFIHDVKIAKQLFSRTAFCGRQSTLIGKQICSDGGSDIIFTDYGQGWQSLSNVFKLAVRKYWTSNHMNGTVRQVVDTAVREMIAEEGVGRPFDPKDRIEVAFYCVVMSIAFGRIFTSKDPEYRRLHDITNVFFQLGDKLALIEFVPILRVPLFQYERLISHVRVLVGQELHN
ncbi:unnamed protein product [Oppiella nova]|uniref:Cytochrome P450 n=1 Tax=Oppiella nova TaxID=334625 RepID=A0A7R9LR63_9ACAR|nr:unnamed protein product [Oppiella nova]CAG2166183.1 unnamed protein product [Oppiella nova]